MAVASSFFCMEMSWVLVQGESNVPPEEEKVDIICIKTVGPLQEIPTI